MLGQYEKIFYGTFLDQYEKIYNGTFLGQYEKYATALCSVSRKIICNGKLAMVSFGKQDC